MNNNNLPHLLLGTLIGYYLVPDFSKWKWFIVGVAVGLVPIATCAEEPIETNLTNSD